MSVPANKAHQQATIDRLPPLEAARRKASRWNGLTMAILCIATFTPAYFVLFWPALPTPSSKVGLGLGAGGYMLMLGAQTLYTIRKRSRRVAYGRMSAWLQAHIFLGLTGAACVLLHSSGKFQGLAGGTVMVMLCVIGSGIVGRFFYTTARRGDDGIEIDSQELLVRFALLERRFHELGVSLPPKKWNDLSLSPSIPGWLAALGYRWLLWWATRRARRFVRQLPIAGTSTAFELQRLLVQRFALQLDIRSLTAARRWLAWWHVLHVPLALVMLTLATVHAVVALGYLG